MSKLDNIANKAFHYLLHSVIALLLVDWALELPTIAYGISIYEIALFLLSCVALVRLAIEKGDVFRKIGGVLSSSRWSFVFVMLYLVLGVVTVFYAKTPGYALTKYVVVAQMLFVGACVFYYISMRPNALQGLYLNMALSAVIAGVLALGKYLFFSDGPYPAIVSPLRDYNQYSTILLIGWICAISYTAGLNVSNMRKLSLLALFAGLLMPMIQVSGSRRSYVLSFGIALVVLVYAIVLTVRTVKEDKLAIRRAICTLLVCVLCVGLASSAVSRTVYDLSHISGEPQDSVSAQDRLMEDAGFGKRTLIWDAAVKELGRYDTKALLIGKGASHCSDFYDDTRIPEVQAVHDSYNKNAENPAQKNWMNPHNLFLQDALNGGIVLLLSLIAVIGTAVFYSIRLIRENPAKGIGILLMYAILLLTMFLSSGKGLLAHKFFWLITFMQIIECHSIKKGV